MGHGLLAEHMLACGKGVHHDLRVSHIGCQHMDHINGIVRQQLFVVRIDLRPWCAKLLGPGLGPLLDDITEGHQLTKVLHLRQ